MIITIFTIIIALLLLSTNAYIPKCSTTFTKSTKTHLKFRNHDQLFKTVGSLHSTMYPIDQPDKPISYITLTFETIADFTVFCIVTIFVVLQYMVYSINLVDDVFH